MVTATRSASAPMTSPEAARYIGMSSAWLAKGRMDRDPNTPPYIKIGKAVRYLPQDLDKWLDSRRVEAA